MFFASILTLISLFAVVIGWQMLFPLIGGAFVVTGTAWTILIATVSIFCASILAVFIFVGLGVLLVGTVMAVWTMLAIILFPVLLPILIPLLIILFFIAYFRRKQKIDSNKGPASE